MKIEKISETQIKFLITETDLKEKEITLSEILTQGTSQAREFFREIMEEAIADFNINIDFENGPIIMEAMTVSEDSVMIIVSKPSENHSISNRLNLIPKTLGERKYKQTELIEFEEDNIDELLIDEDLFYIYSFLSLNQVTEASERIVDFSGKSILYKLDKNYYLAVQKTGVFDEKLQIILSEYGQKHVSSSISGYFLEEHGEILIKENAIEILTSI